VTPERWHRIIGIVNEALSRSGDARSAFLDDACGGDGILRSDVDAMLAVHTGSGSWSDVGLTIRDTATSPAGPAALARDESERYRIGRELARGGMGAIHEATDVRLSRTVAVKRLLTRSGRGDARLRREALITASLQHPAIVPVFDIGELADRSPFYAMKLVDGTSLDLAITRAPTLEARLALLPHAVTAVEAVAYAHSRGIVHRDLKPHNVLVGAFGETVVVDWGLAKQVYAADETVTVGVSSDEIHTRLGTVMGTPAYMPPEQAAGAVVDARADVYALGAMLYHLLTGKRPHDTPRLLRSEPHLPIDLVTIVEKAMATAPSERYRTAQEMAADLRNFQTGQLVGAHRYTTWQLFRRAIARHPVAVSFGALAAVALVSALAVFIARQARVREVRQTKRALDARIVELENVMADEHDPVTLRGLEARLDDTIGHARVASQELAPAGALIVRGDDALDRRIHAVLAGFNADTYSIPPRFRNVVAAAMARTTQRVASARARENKRSVWPIITHELDALGLPEELGYIAWMESDLIVSSSFRPADSAGLWQLKGPTAREHGLRVDDTVDERLDAAKSTHVAVQMLADMFAQIGEDATLIAVIAYPLGVDKMRGFLHEIAMEKGGWRSGRRSYWHFYRTHRLTAQTEDYVPMVIALILADRASP
jgi:hypothetical protein